MIIRRNFIRTTCMQCFTYVKTHYHFVPAFDTLQMKLNKNSGVFSWQMLVAWYNVCSSLFILLEGRTLVLPISDTTKKQQKEAFCVIKDDFTNIYSAS